MDLMSQLLTRCKPIHQAMVVYQGQTHGHEGFLLTPDEVGAMMEQDAENSSVLFPYLIATDFLGRKDSLPSRYVIDFGDMDVLSASKFSSPFERVKSSVLPARKKAAKKEEERNYSVIKNNPSARVNKHHANFLKQVVASLLSQVKDDECSVRCSSIHRLRFPCHQATNIRLCVVANTSEALRCPCSHSTTIIHLEFCNRDFTGRGS